MKKSDAKISKYLSYILRHKPESAGIRLDEEGWADLEAVLSAARKAGFRVDRNILERVVAENDKQRFGLSEDGLRIRARQGHSIAVNPGLVAETPPEFLYHGTATRFLESILDKGLVPRSRQYVHLSTDEKTATAVGARHGKPVVLIIEAGKMNASGHDFFLSENGVWLTGNVPPDFIRQTSGV